MQDLVRNPEDGFSHGADNYIHVYSICIGFLETLKAVKAKMRIQELTLQRLRQPASVGAASLGARAVGVTLPMDYDINAETFYHEKL